MAWKKAVCAATSWLRASSKSRTCRSSGTKKTENIEPACCTRCGQRVAPRVDLVGAQPQRAEPGGDGDRVPGQRAGLVDRPGRGQLLHHVGPPAERRGRH